LLLGAKTPWKRVGFTRGFGTRAASRAMTNRQDCRFGRPQVARRVAHKDVRHQVQGLEEHVRRAVSVRRLQAVEQGFSVQYFRFDELLNELRGDAALPPAQLRRRKYLSTALLVIDELGFEPMNRQEASLFFRLVTYRYGRGSILITTNKSVRDWTELLAGDEVLATAILDRLLHKAHVLNIKGRSYRLRDLEQSLDVQRQ
jgi:hypothetical protein